MMSVPAFRRSAVSFMAVVLASALALSPAQALAQDEGSASNEKDEFVYVEMRTSKGDIIIELNQGKAPISVENFLMYVDDGYYEGTIYHRVMPGFMIQGGGFTDATTRKPTKKPIKNEWQNGLSNKRGTIAMARTAVHDSATSQFFINHKDNSSLDQPRDGAAYAVFGKVVEGMDVVDAIADTPTSPVGPQRDYPVEKIEIIEVVRLPDYKPAD